MPSTINAASGGIILSSDSSGAMNIQAGGVTAIEIGTGASVSVTNLTATTLSASNFTATSLTITNTIKVNQGGTGQTSYTDGQLLIGNTTGNTLTKATLTAGSGVTITNGAGTITIAAGGLPAMNIVTGTTQAATAGNQYVLTNVAATTVTLPASPTAGDTVYVTVANSLTTNVVARNGSNIQSLAENLTLNASYASVQLRYADSTRGWVLT